MPTPRDRAVRLPPGVYDRLVTEEVAAELTAGDARTEPLPSERAPHVLGRHLAQVAERLLHALEKQGGGAGSERSLRRAATAALEALNGSVSPAEQRSGEHPAAPLQVLVEVGGGTTPLPRPHVPLSESALLVNEPGEPGLGQQLVLELGSADRVDLLCAFINWYGVRLLSPAIEGLMARGGSLRVITSTYMGVTESRALDHLVTLGAEVRVAYDTPPARTRLHAKAWMFHRATGFTTAYIGSSNLSHSALHDGVEWNVRLSAVDAQPLLAHFDTTFERYWADPAFQAYDPARDRPRLQRAVAAYQGEPDDRLEAFLDVHPWPHQQAMLDRLETERLVRGNWRNLVVAATGTGKTVVAALDYRRLRKEHGELSLLFVVHQERILRQARQQFRNVLREGGFGELWVGGQRPDEGRHVFASIQSLTAAGVESVPPTAYQVLILDEMHHIAAPTYAALMQHLEPQILLGLSATPERSDGQDTLHHFGGRISADLRLWDALEAGLLAPFHYFGLTSDVDLRHLNWDRGGYRESELENAYLDADRVTRAQNLLAEIARLVPDYRRMRALGFCVSVRHAEFMADAFRRAGLGAECLTAGTPVDVRDRAVGALRRGELQALFTVDLFNEGVDIPEVDTLVLLRPTASATVFIQQLGRGLRLCEGKPCVTVLDFIGQQHRKFRFDRNYRALTGLSLADLEHAVKGGFSQLPAGCHIHLEREPREAVLASLRNAIPRTKPALLQELRTLGNVSLSDFLRLTGADLGDLYSQGRSLTAMRRAVGYLPAAAPVEEAAVSRALERLITLDDPTLLRCLAQRLAPDAPPRLSGLPLAECRSLRMLLSTLFPEERLLRDAGQQALDLLWVLADLRRELIELVQVLDGRVEVLPRPLAVSSLADVPLQVHCHYSRNEALAALGVARPSTVREGVKWLAGLCVDVFWVTLRKDEQHYTPTTMYRDYFLSPGRFHWESQSGTTAASDTGQRYINHAEGGTHVVIFCRERRQEDGRTARYLCLGPATYESHRGEKPMQITWRLREPLPAALYERFRAAAG